MWDMFLKGGLLMWPILALSVWALTVIVWKVSRLSALLRELRRDAPAGSLAPLWETKISGAPDKALRYAVSRLILSEERHIESLSLIATLSPLLGLTGTVMGIIETFQVLSSAGLVEANALAGGIWQALLTTVAGLLVAMPAYAAFHALEGVLSTLELRLEERFFSDS